MTTSRVITDPLGSGAICRACGAYHPTFKRAADCTCIGSVPLPAAGDDVPTATRPPVALGPTYQAGPRTYQVRPPRSPLWARAAALLGLLLCLAAVAGGMWLAFERSTPAPGCGRACMPAEYVAPGPAGADE